MVKCYNNSIMYLPCFGKLRGEKRFVYKYLNDPRYIKTQPSLINEL